MHSLTLKSPAKLNLYLRVLRRLPSGYHELLTLFHRISLFDTLTLKKKSGPFELHCDHPELSPRGDNLITQAYRLLQKQLPNLPGVRVNLTKRIPMSGGLGGGSSNAAFFLLGMNRLYDLGLKVPALIKIGRRLGADVPFFLYNANQALGKKLGDKIIPRKSRAKWHFVLVCDPQGLSTAKVYRNFPVPLPEVFLTKESRALTMLCGKLDQLKNFQSLGRPHNDLELSAFRLRPSIQKTISKFHHLGILTAGMSGSGPSVFAILPSLKEAVRIAAKIRRLEPTKKVLVCHTY